MTKDSDIDLLIVKPAPRNRRKSRSGSRCHWEYRLSGRCAHYGDGAFRGHKEGTSSAESRTPRTSITPEEAVDALGAEWVGKADLDFKTAVRLVAEAPH